MNLANQNAAAIQQQTQAQAAADMAGTQSVTAILDSIAKGINTGAGLYASQAGATPSATTPVKSNPNSTISISESDFADIINHGYAPQAPTTGNLIGA